MIFSDLPTHLENLESVFKNVKSMALIWIQKSAFMVYSGTILGFIVSKERKTPNPKKIEALVKMLVPKTL